MTMKTYTEVDQLIVQWKAEGLSKAEIVVQTAEACMGWPYVWGGYGQYCTSKNRKSFAERSSCPASESAVIVKKCQVLNGSKGDCSGCKWYPGGRTRFFDCRGFIRWLLQQVGISLKGSGADQANAALCLVAPLGILDLEIKSFKKKYAHKKVRGRM